VKDPIPQRVPADAVRAQLSRILASEHFVRSERLSRFLEFTVEQTLAGRAELLKEYPIGVEVFGRKDSFDPRIDAIVPVQAVSLRSRVNDYYARQGANDPILIEYVKGGYAPAMRDRTTAEPGLAPAEQASIAVLPFVNLSPDPENEYFSDGLTEEIIHLLSQVQGLEVTSRTSSFALKGERLDSREIGSKLNVTVLLEGSVRRAGDHLRVTAQLIRADSGKDLWSNSYDRRMQDVFAIQQEIAGSIATALRRNLGTERRRYTDNLEAYESYLRGRYAWEHRSAGEALRHFDLTPIQYLVLSLASRSGSARRALRHESCELALERLGYSCAPALGYLLGRGIGENFFFASL